jgi:hypothetical protein
VLDKRPVSSGDAARVRRDPRLLVELLCSPLSA